MKDEINKKEFITKEELIRKRRKNKEKHTSNRVKLRVCAANATST